MTTITIDRAALERVLDALEDAKKNHGLAFIEEMVDIKEALAQPVQEPVGQIGEDKHGLVGHIYDDRKVKIGDKLYTTPPLPVQPEERNFCQRCGKRTADLTTIHTCTPPLQPTIREW